MSKLDHDFPVISSTEISRRTFLKSAAGGSAALAAASTLPIEAIGRESTGTSRTNTPYDEVLRRYGSELGDIRESE